MVKIKGLQKTSVIDYPGKISAVVFLGGCNFRCPYCQNPDLIKDELPDMKETDFFSFLEERRKWIDGVCVSGGEPTIYKDLPAFIEKIKNKGFLVKLDTNGSNPGMLKVLLPSLDYIAMDMKAPLEKYKEVCRGEVDVNKVKESIEIVKNSGVDHEFRSTIMPALHTREDVVKMASQLEGGKVFFLQGFRNLVTLDPKFREEGGFSTEDMESFAKECDKHIKTRLRV
jgi:pyruvate formate lyase activating enzyme